MTRRGAQGGADKGLTAEWTRTLTVPLPEKASFGTGWEGPPAQDPADVLPRILFDRESRSVVRSLATGWPSRVVRLVPAGSAVRCSGPTIPLAVDATVVDVSAFRNDPRLSGVRLVTLRFENRTDRPCPWSATVTRSNAGNIEPVIASSHRLEAVGGNWEFRGTVAPRASAMARFAMVPLRSKVGGMRWPVVFAEADAWVKAWEFTSLPAWLVPAVARSPVPGANQDTEWDAATRFAGSVGGPDPLAATAAAIDPAVARLVSAPEPDTPAGWIHRHAAWSVVQARAKAASLRSVESRASEAAKRCLDQLRTIWPGDAPFPMRRGSETLFLEDIAALDAHRSAGVASPFESDRIAAACGIAWERCFLPAGPAEPASARVLRPKLALLASTDVGEGRSWPVPSRSVDAWRMASALAAHRRVQAGATLARCLLVQGAAGGWGPRRWLAAWTGVAIAPTTAALRVRPAEPTGFLRTPFWFDEGFGVATVRGDEGGVRATISVGGGGLSVRSLWLPRPAGFTPSSALVLHGRERFDARWKVDGNAISVEWNDAVRCDPGRLLYVSLA